MLSHRVPYLNEFQSAPCGILKAKLSIGRITCLQEMGLNSILTILIVQLGATKKKYGLRVKKHDGESREAVAGTLQLILLPIARDISRFDHIVPWLRVGWSSLELADRLSFKLQVCKLARQLFFLNPWDSRLPGLILLRQWSGTRQQVFRKAHFKP